MMRKVSRIGPSTLMVSLPSKWVKQQQIQKGDDLHVTEQADTLVIQPTGTKKQATQAQVNISGLNASLAWYYLTAAYRQGAEEILVTLADNHLTDPSTGENIKSVDFIKTVTDSFIGMAIMRNTQTHCLIKEISAPKEEEFATILRRIFLCITNMFDDILTAVKEQDKQALLHITLHSDVVINKFVDYSIRLMGRMRSRSSTLYAVLMHLEEIGDGLKFIAKRLGEKQQQKKIADSLKTVQAFFTQTEKFYYTGNQQLFADIDDAKRAIRSTLIPHAEKSEHENTLLIVLNNIFNQCRGIINAKLFEQTAEKPVTMTQKGINI